MYTNRISCSLIALTIFIATLVIVSYHGKINRAVASGKTTATIDSPEKAYAIWKENKVHGRILLLFDNYPHMRGRIDYKGAPQLDRHNLVEFGIFNNIIRRVYLVVPDAAWEEFRHRETIHPIRVASSLERGLYLYNLNGMPFIAVPLSSLPHISEQPLVYINNSVFDYAQTMQFLSQKKIVSDSIISCREHGA
jgi:hypothetical protein